MSFSAQVKEELIKNEYENTCCQRALLYGMCLFGKSFSAREVALQSENKGTAQLFADLLLRLFKIKTNFRTSPKGRNFTVSTQNPADSAKLFKSFGHEAGSLRINHSNFDCELCRNAFVAGAFLACGTVSDPNKDYHLEFTIPYLNLAKSLLTLLDEFELKPKYSRRKDGYHIVYFKESESIESCMYIMGASDATFEIMNIKIVKDFRNKANRQANCDTANINKMVNAVAEQVHAIEKIWSKKGREYLPDNLQAVAQLRYDNPDLSLAELAVMCNPPLSRSGINHRLRRIIDISREI